ncbi:flagellar hook-associated protein 1 FlgK [Orenia metallireducens]|jgi:flagellar hook-associated protein 1 FlgK|uniref:Flagellar hook-associated protein 1 n=1 Tax=Orenia metallireducens TaxID=1413210 RepID=A0A285GC93_9FIRM|nr:flagellar hook-associated protein FlgK [Orenia metallireducens]PRX32576.1 flagellar hook-associated protein 1 FlgK [Orenia metallireducens]SNY20794.1 flagellar hook-associated protein 1 FlgK [Orenia metallireducens]
MGSTFSGIEIGKRAVQVQKKSLEVVGHNIANANTEGYSRQEVILSATSPLNVDGVGAGQVGTGVKISKIQRMRDDFTDMRLREESTTQGMWEVTRDSLSELELIFNEPSEDGLRNMLDGYWNSLQDLNNNPESEAVRATVRQRALAVTDTFNHLHSQLSEYQNSLNSRVEIKVNDINSYATQIADLNTQIVEARAVGQEANDLEDKRNLLLQKLSKITNIRAKEDEIGAVRVSISSQQLVAGSRVTELETVEDSSNNDFLKVQWENGNNAIFSGGEIKGLLDARDDSESGIPHYIDELNQVAVNFMDEFNQQHREGYGLSDVEMNTMVSSSQGNPANPLENGSGSFEVILNGNTIGPIDVASGASLNDIAASIDSQTGLNAAVVSKSSSINYKKAVISKSNAVDDKTASLGSEGDFDITIGDNTETISVLATDSLEDIRDKINASDISADITASINADNMLVMTPSDITNKADITYNNGDDIVQALGIADSESEVIGYEGKFDISIGGDEDTISVLATDSLEDIRDKINSSLLSGDVTASINDNNMLVITPSDVNNRAEISHNSGDNILQGLGIENNILEIKGTNADDKIDLVNTSDDGERDIVNLLGMKGIGVGRDFFTGTSAKDITISTAIKNDLRNIAAASKTYDRDNDSKNDYPRNSDVALKLAKIGSTDLLPEKNSTSTFSEYYSSVIAKLGVDSQRAERMVQNQETLTKQMNEDQASYSGVSLDEEMGKMIQYQHAYNAAAKIVSTMDELLETLVNGLKR